MTFRTETERQPLPASGTPFSRCLLGLFCAALLAPLLPSAVCAGPCQTFGLGGQAIAMGGAVAAHAEDYAATFYNPAGLAFLGKATLGLGFIYGSPDLRINGDTQDVDLIRAFQVGGSFGIGSEWFLSRIRLGVAAHIPTSTALLLGASDPIKPNYVLYTIDPQRMAIYMGGAVRILPSLSFGGGVSMLAEADFNLNLSLASSSFLTHYSPSRFNFDPILGIKFKPSESFSLAAVYREAKSATLKPELRLFLGETQVVPTITVYNLFGYEPREVVLAAMYRYRERLTLEVDVTWMDYSEFQAPTPKYEFEEPVPDWVKVLLSMENFPDAGFHDIYVPRVGAELIVNRHVTLRGGYCYRPSPVPDQRGITNYADSDKHVISVGGGLTVFLPAKLGSKPFHVDGVFQLHVLEERAVVKEGPQDPVGDYTIDGEIFLGGIYIQFKF
ncbi:MAG: outer membrane protein transport protein [Thermodesulfobacteriota bacterium]